jgi:S1-C subfamily serine protease
MGSPLGFENSVTAGILSGVQRAIPSGGRTPALVGLLQTDAPISPGNSGGGLFAGDGTVMGINVAYIPPAGGAVSIGFAIPATTVVSAVQQLLSSGHVEHAYLGILPQPVTPETARQLHLPVTQGALVLEVVPNGPAAKAGLKPGDVIVQADGKDIAMVEDLYAILRAHRPGDVLKLQVQRGSEKLDLSVTLSDRPK